MSTITLEPAGTSVVTSLGVTSGRWIANGTDNPAGALAWLRHAIGAADLQWQMADTTAGIWLTNGNTFTAAQWDAAPGLVDADGFKAIELTVSPTWGIPTAGDSIDFQIGGSGDWEMKTGVITSGHYQLVSAVPEPSAGIMLAGVVLMAGIRLLARARQWSSR